MYQAYDLVSPSHQKGGSDRPQKGAEEKKNAKSYTMWFLSHEAVLLAFFLNYHLHPHFCCFGYFIFLRPHVLLKHKCFPDWNQFIALAEVWGFPNPDWFLSWAAAEIGITDSLRGRGSKRLEPDLFPFSYRMLVCAQAIPPVPKEGGVVATNCRATFESQVLSPASLVFQTWGTLLSCLLFFYLWNLLQKICSGMT